MIDLRSTLALALTTILAACGPERGTEPPPAGETRVVIVSATASYTPTMDRDRLTIRLRNDGGAGSFALEYRSLPTSPNGPRRVQTSDFIPIAADYDETISVDLIGMSQVQAVAVRSRPANTAVATQTDCEVLRGATSYCP